jgi:hypothetical protein
MNPKTSHHRLLEAAVLMLGLALALAAVSASGVAPLFAF